MYRLIFSELFYHKRTIAAAFILTLIVSLARTVEDSMISGETGYYILGYTAFMYMLGRWGHYILSKDEIDVIHAKLPLSIRKVGLTRLFTGLTIWFFLLSILLSCYLIFRSEFNRFNIWSIASINGVVLILNSIPFIWNDYLYYSKRKRKKLISYLFYYTAVFTILGFIFVLTFTIIKSISDLQDNFQQIFFTGYAALLFNLLGIITSYLSYRLFMARYSYLGSEFGKYPFSK